MPRFLIKLFKAAQLIWFALKVGMIGGLGAVLYVTLIGIIYNVVFLGRLEFVYHEFLHSPASRWGVGIILVPVLGGLIVVWLIKNYGNNERGIREPDILHFIHPEEGKKRYLIEIIKTLASAITIGTGGCVGWEIPVAQLGLTLSYLFARVKSLPAQHRLVFIAAGAAASISAVFNAPCTGIMFALELLLFAFTISHVLLIGIAALTSIQVWRLFFGHHKIFKLQIISPENIVLYCKQLVLYLPLGILIGLTAILLIGGIRWFKGLFERNIPNLYLRHSIGVGLVGVMLYLFMKYFGHYYIDALGFATIQGILNYTLNSPYLILLIFCCKIVGLCLTIGSGAIGGLFAPSLFLGAALGAVFGLTVQHYVPSLQIDIIYFVIAGMGGLLASVTGGILTAIIFILEMSKSQYMLLPILITTITGTLIRIIIYPKGIYTLKLYQHGLMFNYRKL